jgi:ABC-type transport system involved in multi-copper enzyme maturation permease subunit
MELSLHSGLMTRLWRFLFRTQWSGPIFEKELKIMARQQRYYVLRLVYLLTLIAMMGMVWVEAMPRGRLDGQMAARMAQAGKNTVVYIAWFQFIGLQLVTVITLSSAISEEIAHRTLPTLMTTPITSQQIVLGKLASKGLQLLLLFCISIPLLTMVRVFGGVPWGYLLSTFCMTVTMVWFLSCLTLLFSVMFKRSYTALIFTVIGAAILFGLMPMIWVYARETADFQFIEEMCNTILVHTCPYVAFAIETESMLSAGARGGISLRWPFHCVFMILLSLPVLSLACVLVRRAALHHMVAHKNRKEYIVPSTPGKREILYRPLFLHNWIARTYGTGMVWKEFLMPVLGRFRFVVYIGALAFMGIFLLGLIIAILFEHLELLGIIFMLAIVFFFTLAIIFTVVVPATCITSEKESRTWPILLTTTLSHGQILRGKIAGVLRRIILAWSPFLVIFAMLAYTLNMPASTAIQVTVVALVSVGFLVALGIYVSTRCQRTTPAVVTNLSLVGVLWGLLPGFAMFLQAMRWEWIRDSVLCRFFIEGTLHMTPPGLMTTLLQYTSGGRRLWYYQTSAGLNYGLAFLVLYGGATALLLWRAKVNLRQHTV